MNIQNSFQTTDISGVCQLIINFCNKLFLYFLTVQHSYLRLILLNIILENHFKIVMLVCLTVYTSWKPSQDLYVCSLLKMYNIEGGCVVAADVG